MRKNFYKFALSLLALGWSSGALAVATCTSVQSGNWNSAGTWSCVGTPTVTTPGGTNFVVIAAGHTVSLNGNNRSAATLTINAGGTLDDDGKRLTVSGNVVNNGTFGINGGVLRMTGANSTLSGTGTFDNTDVEIETTGITIPAGSTLEFANQAQIRVGNNNTASLTINGVITGNGMAAGDRILRVDNNTNSSVTINGTINAPNAFIEIQAGGTITNNGTVTVQYLDGNGDATSTWTQGNNSNLTLSQPAQNWAGTFSASATGNTVTFNGAATPFNPATYYNIAGAGVTCPLAAGITVLSSSPCLGVPTVTTNAATLLSSTGATLNGTVSSNGASTAVTFEHGLTAAYGATVTATGSPLAAGASNTAVSAAITGLTCGTLYHFRAKGVNSFGTTNGGDLTFTSSACPPSPLVLSINTASANPTASNTVVSWTVIFNDNMTGVDLTDFTLLSAGGVTAATLLSVSGSNSTYTVTANTGTGNVGTLTLRLVDNDSIINASSIPLGGAGAGNGSFSGQAYTLIIPTCTPGLLFCDDFERSVIVGGSNTAGAVGSAPGYGAWTVAGLTGGALPAGCAGVAGNRGCAGIDSDIPPFSTVGALRANATRAMYTRWTSISVTSPVINLAGKTGARVSFWLRRGSDCFSEWPSNNLTPCNGVIPPFTPTSGEEFQVQYKNNLGAWIVLAQYPMDDAPGEILVPVIGLPDDALHATFQLRFAQPGGSGSGATNGGAPGVRGYDYWHVDNVVLEEVPGVSFTGPFCDTFEGDLSRWDMAGTGNVNIGSTHFQNGLHNMDLRWNAVSATTKATDLSTNSGNNLISFWVKRGTGVFTSLPNGTGSEYPDTVAKGLKFEYRNNLGAWVQLGTTFPGGGTAGQIFLPTAATNNFAIPADAKHANFKLRVSLLSGSGFFDQDYWHVDDVCVGTTPGSTDLGMSMTSNGTFSPGQYVTYTMTVTNGGANPDPGPITITDTLPVGLTYVGGSAGWACTPAGQVVTCTQSGGLLAGASTALTLTATVDATASGTITNSATVGGQANDAALGNNTATKTDTIFVPGYVFTDKACALDGVAVGSGAQCNTITWSPQIAGTALGNVYISAVNASNVPIQLNATNPTTVNMQFGLSCNDPVAHAGVQATFYDATSTVLPLCETNIAPLNTVDIPTTWSTARALVFAAATPSVGPFSFKYDDVGDVELFMRNSAVTSQMGRSGSFVVKPARFLLTGIKCTTADSTNCGGGALPTGNNPAAANAAGASFIPAGAPFSVSVMALNSIGNRTPNYGQEIVPESVKLTPTNVVAGMVAAPAIGGAFGAFGADHPSGTPTGLGGVAHGAAFSWGEVGIITLTPSVADGSYLGAGDVVGTVSGNVGRFYPDHFDTAVNQVANVPMACPAGVVCPTNFNGFVYSGQSFSLTVTARNTSGLITANYNTTTGFARAAGLSAWGGLGSLAAPSGAGTLGVASVTAFVAGSLTAANELYTFTTAPTAPTNIFLRANDTEASSLRAVAANSVEGGVAVVSGRIRVANAYGSEQTTLPLSAMVEFFDGTRWAGSATDSVTAINTATDLAATIVKPPLAAGNVSALSSGSVTANAGVIPFILNKSGVEGSADLAVTAPAYMQQIPGRITFGVYKGANQFIYLREAY